MGKRLPNMAYIFFSVALCCLSYSILKYFILKSEVEVEYHWTWSLKYTNYEFGVNDKANIYLQVERNMA